MLGAGQGSGHPVLSILSIDVPLSCAESFALGVELIGALTAPMMCLLVPYPVFVPLRAFVPWCLRPISRLQRKPSVLDLPPPLVYNTPSLTH